MILSIDPGRKPGYVLLDETSLVQRRYFAGRPQLPAVAGAWLVRPTPQNARCTVCEAQWLHSLRNAQAALTLANEAGWQLLAALTGYPCFVSPQKWRAALRVPKRVTKDAVQSRVEHSLTAGELAFLAVSTPARRGDLLDAIAIGWGGWLLGCPVWRPPL